MWHRWESGRHWCSCGSLRRYGSSVFEKHGRSSEQSQRETRRVRSLAMRALVAVLFDEDDEGPPEPVGEG